MNGEIKILSDATALAHEAAARFLAAAEQAIAERGRCAVALAGGSTPAALYRLLAAKPYRDRLDWARIDVFFGDERCVPPDDVASNYRMANETLLDHVPLPSTSIYRIHGEWAPGDAAEDYAQQLGLHVSAAQAVAGPASASAALPRFDLILLGMGDDGHTASLFPGMPALAETRRTVVASTVPAYVRPQVERITLTLPALNAAARVMFMVAGAPKAEKVRAVLGPGPTEERQLLPSARVQPAAGALVWLLDQAAASRLHEKRDG